MAKKKPSPRKAATKKPAHAARPRTTHPPRPRQPSLEGVPSVPDAVVARAETYMEAREAKGVEARREAHAKAALIADMRLHGLTSYRLEDGAGGVLLTISAVDKLAAKKGKKRKVVAL